MEFLLLLLLWLDNRPASQTIQHIGGSCRKYRVEDGCRVPLTEKFGWKVLGQDAQFDMLGVSVSEALAHHTASLNAPACTFCAAEQHMLELQADARLEREKAVSAGRKKQKTG